MRIIILNILFFFYAAANVNAQSTRLQNQFDYAKNLYENELYFDAVTELKRLLFFDEEEKYVYDSQMMMGLSYKAGGKFSEALDHFTLAEMSTDSSHQIFEARIEKVKINILRRTTEQAFQILRELKKDSEFSEVQDEINYWEGWAFIFSNDWKAAAKRFNSIDPDHPLKKIALNTDEKKYSVTFAKVISYILPGAGQFYTGNYLSGALSLGWNALFGYLSINAFIEERVFDGIIISNLLWFRFYRGNIQNAGKFAIEENRKISNRTLRYLQKDYQGEKP